MLGIPAMIEHFTASIPAAEDAFPRLEASDVNVGQVYAVASEALR